MRLSVLLADDHVAMRAVLARHLETQFRVHRAVADGRQLLEAALEGEADVIVSDVHMPELSGFDVMRALRLLGRQVPFVLVSVSADNVRESIALGAAAFVCKTDVVRDLVPAVLAAHAGRTYISATALPLIPSRLDGQRPSTGR